MFFAKFLQTAAQNDSNDTPLERYQRGATFACRTLSLIHNGLRAVSKLPKCGHSVFHDIKIDEVHCIKHKTALLQSEYRTASERQTNCIIHLSFFVTFLYYNSAMFLLFESESQTRSRRTAMLSKGDCMLFVSLSSNRTA